MLIRSKSVIISLNYREGRTFIIKNPGKEVNVISNNELGQGLLEYALILILVAIVVMALIIIFGPAVGNMFSNIISNM